MEKIINNNAYETCELSGSELDNVTGGGATGTVIKGLRLLGGRNVTLQTIADATVLNYGYAMYKITGKSKYINTKSFLAAEKRLRNWSKKNKVTWGDLIDVLS